MRIRIIIFLLIMNCSVLVRAQGLSLSPREIQIIADIVFANECSGKDAYLLQWNEGEDFLSLGIGHFIWYPEGEKGPFEESFPEFIGYLQSLKETVPEWLNKDPVPYCPWLTREDFLRDHQGGRAQELRQFLQQTKTQQAHFIVARFDRALPLMLEDVPERWRGRIRKQFYRVASSPAGIYAMIDYVNFKGLGVSPGERYQGKGWGLLQVLSGMVGEEKGRKALQEFAQTADSILTERVENSPPERNEKRWLRGWRRRVQSYLDIADNH